MSERIEQKENSRNPWKLAMITLLAAGIAALASGIVVAKVVDAQHQEAAKIEETQTPPEPVVSAAPRPVEDCSRYAAGADRDGKHILKDGLFGGAIGAGLGAAAGAIVDGGNGAGKGAGVGALVGAAGGTVYGLDQENKRTAHARNAHQQCVARRGY